MHPPTHVALGFGPRVPTAECRMQTRMHRHKTWAHGARVPTPASWLHPSYLSPFPHFHISQPTTDYRLHMHPLNGFAKQMCHVLYLQRNLPRPRLSHLPPRPLDQRPFLIFRRTGNNTERLQTFAFELAA